MDNRVFAAAQKHFGDLGPEVVATMYAIAMAESGGNPSAYNGKGLDDSYGLWQININPKANPDMARFDLYDIDQNARAARIIYDRQGLTAWTTYTGGAYRSHIEGVKGAPKGDRDMGERSAEYEQVARYISGYLADQQYLADIQERLQPGSDDPLTPSAARALLVESGHMTAEPMLDLNGRPMSPQDLLYDRQRENANRLESLYEEAYAIDPNYADADFGWRISDKKRIELSGLDAQRGFAPSPYQFQLQDNGDLLIFNPNTGKMENGGNYPNAIGKTVAQDRNGNLISYDPYTRQSEVLVPDFGFPDLDPRVKFATETLMSAAQIEADWAGVELAARGQELEALAQDSANMILTGQMVYEESRLNLDRFDRALTQRREERQQVIDYGVTRESLRTLPSGEVVTTLPFARQTSEILNRFIPGGGLTERDFELGISVINPEQAGNDVLRGSAYDSPLPGIIAGLQSNKAKTDAILANAPSPGANTTAVLGG